MYGFLLVLFSNCIPVMHRFWDIQLHKCRDLENIVRGPSRSLEMSPCDTAHMTSYWLSTATTAIWRFWDIQRRIIFWPWQRVKGRSRSLRVAPLDSLRVWQPPSHPASQTRCCSKYRAYAQVKIGKQVPQLMLTNLRDAFGGQSRSPDLLQFRMLGMVAYCAILSLFCR